MSQLNFNIQDTYIEALESLRGSNLELKLSFGKHRPPKNSISPSQFTVKNARGVIKQCFKPEDLELIGYISRLEAIKLNASRQVDIGGLVVMTIGTAVHEIVLPQMEKLLNNKGINAICELPLVSRKYCLNGTADFVVIDYNTKEIDLYDMKTGSISILKKRTNPSYNNLMQLVAYSNALEDIFEGFTVRNCNILYAQTSPKSKATYVEYDKNKMPILDYDDAGNALLEPEYLAMSELYTISFQELKNTICTTRPKPLTYQQLFEETCELALQINQEIKDIKPNYTHWSLDDNIYNDFIDSIVAKLKDRGIEL